MKSQQYVNSLVEKFVSLFGNKDDIYGRGPNITVSKVKSKPYIDRFVEVVESIDNGEDHIQIMVDIGESNKNLLEGPRFKTIYDSRYPTSKYVDGLSDVMLKAVYKYIGEWFISVDMRRIEYWATPVVELIGGAHRLLDSSAIIVLPMDRLGHAVDISIADQLCFYKSDNNEISINSLERQVLATYGLVYQQQGCFNKIPDLQKHEGLLKGLTFYKTMGKPIYLDVEDWKANDDVVQISAKRN